MVWLSDHLKTGPEVVWLKQDGDHSKTGHKFISRNLMVLVFECPVRRRSLYHTDFFRDHFYLTIFETYPQ
jgi:hypothetical protein